MMENLMRDFYKNKKVFITGHTGFKGAWLAKILLEFEAIVFGYSSEIAQRELYERVGLEKNMEESLSDIRDLEQLKQSLTHFKPDIVFHLAAQPLVRDSYTSPVYTYETNVMGTVNVLESIRYCDSVKSVVNITTDKVYANMETKRGYVETDKLCGQDPYSNSKSCSELITFSYLNSYFDKEDSPAISTARGGNVIGAGDFSKDRIVPDCVRAARNKEILTIRNPQAIRPYQYILDCLSGYLLLAKKQYENKLIAGNYNFGPDMEECITTLGLVEKFKEFWNGSFGYIVKEANLLHESQLLLLDNSKAIELLGWSPKFGIDENLKSTIEFYKEIKFKSFDSKVSKHINDYFAERHLGKG